MKTETDKKFFHYQLDDILISVIKKKLDFSWISCSDHAEEMQKHITVTITLEFLYAWCRAHNAQFERDKSSKVNTESSQRTQTTQPCSNIGNSFSELDEACKLIILLGNEMLSRKMNK